MNHPKSTRKSLAHRDIRGLKVAHMAFTAEAQRTQSLHREKPLYSLRFLRALCVSAVSPVYPCCKFRFRGTILCVVSLFVFAAAGRAQQKSYCLVPPPSPFKHNAVIVTLRDEARGHMRTTLKHPHVLNTKSGEANEAVYLYASFVHQERRSSKPTIDVVFISVAREPKYRNVYNLILFTDKRRLPTAEAAGYSSGVDDNGSITEAVKITLPYDELLQVTNAKKVEARLGSTELEFTNNHLESLRELAGIVAPAANASK